ncbi:DMT family protein [Porticoccus sp.]
MRALVMMNPILASIGLLLCSNVFMTFAWYAHLRELNHKPWVIAALLSWGIALLEYLFQVPANRIGYTALNVGQLKVMQEVITLSIFVPFSVMYLKEPLKLDYLWAGLCLVGAVYFMFRDRLV